MSRNSQCIFSVQYWINKDLKLKHGDLKILMNLVDFACLGWKKSNINSYLHIGISKILFDFYMKQISFESMGAFEDWN